jgi:hypothetical protein
MALSISGVAFLPAIILAGSPGTIYKRKKAIKVMPIRTGISWKNLLIVNFSNVPPHTKGAERRKMNYTSLRPLCNLSTFSARSY